MFLAKKKIFHRLYTDIIQRYVCLHCTQTKENKIDAEVDKVFHFFEITTSSFFFEPIFYFKFCTC